jgi:hypothetical protein
MIDVDVSINTPAQWVSIEPPDGIALVSIEPGDPTTYRPNIVVALSPRPKNGRGLLPATPDVIDNYLNDVVDELSSILEDFEFGEAWLFEVPPDQGPTQRMVARYKAGHARVEIVQQHVWFDDVIVVATATVPADCSTGLAATIDRCLSSVHLGPTALSA